MSTTVKTLSLSLGLSSALLLAACKPEQEVTAAQGGNASTESSTATHAGLEMQSPTAVTAEQRADADPALAMAVYKSETCGCCKDWVEHMAQHDFGITVHHPLDLASQKDDLGVAPRYQSCHTAVTTDGFVFEGHVPAKLVNRFLAEKPAGAIGQAVPGMPLGSPGMDVGDRYMHYDVLLLLEDGSSRVYAQMNSYQEQF